MKVQRFTLTLTLATLFVVALVAIPLIAQEQQECDPDEKWKKTCSHVQVFGNGSVVKKDNRVTAKAQCRANQVIKRGWYWIHAKVLPHSDDPRYNSMLSNDYRGILHKTVNASRSGVAKSKGYSFVSIWGTDDEEYYSVYIDLPD